MVLKPKRRRFNLCLSVALLILTVPWPAYAEGATEEIGEGRRILEQASDTANSIGDGKQKASALQAISRAQTLAGDVKGALQTANSIEDAKQKDGTLWQIATAQAMAGDVKGALAWALNQSSPYLRSYALLGVAEGVLKLKPR